MWTKYGGGVKRRERVKVGEYVVRMVAGFGGLKRGESACGMSISC